MRAKIVIPIAVILLLVAAFAVTFASAGTVAFAADAPTPLYSDGKDYIECPIGMRLFKIELPSGWRFKSDVDTTASAIGNINDYITYDVEYFSDADPATPIASATLKLKLVQATVRFVDEKSTQRPLEIKLLTGFEDGVLSMTIEQLANPYTRKGYHLKGWRIEDGDVIEAGEGEGKYKLGAPYTFYDADIIDDVINVYIVWEPDTDTKVTLNIYYEKTTGGFESAPSAIDATKSGVSDGTITIDADSVVAPEGFVFDHAESGGNTQSEFKVAADGSTVINVYHVRKKYTLEFKSGEYSEMLPGGTLPSNATVRFGEVYELPKSIGFEVYGYTFDGWTDGVTQEANGELKVFRNNYTIAGGAEALALTAHFAPNNNTEYIVTEYLDGVPRRTVRLGKTGSNVVVGNGPLGFKRVEDGREVLEGEISGYLKDENGEVVGGSMLELVAFYESIKYVLQFYNSEVATMDGVVYGEEIVLPEPPVREGYTFRWWLVNGIKYEAGNTLIMPASDISVKAVWLADSTAGDALGVPVVVTEEETFAAWEIALIVIGAVLFAAGVTVGSVFLAKRIKKNKRG